MGTKMDMKQYLPKCPVCNEPMELTKCPDAIDGCCVAHYGCRKCIEQIKRSDNTAYKK